MNRLTIACIATVSVLLTSCRTVAPSAIVGRWEMDVDSSNGFEDLPKSAELRLMPDGTVSGSAIFLNETDFLQGSYRFDGKSFTVVKDIGGRKVTVTLQCSIDKDTMTLRDENGVFVYRRK